MTIYSTFSDFFLHSLSVSFVFFLFFFCCLYFSFCIFLKYYYKIFCSENCAGENKNVCSFSMNAFYEILCLWFFCDFKSWINLQFYFRFFCCFQQNHQNQDMLMSKILSEKTWLFYLTLNAHVFLIPLFPFPQTCYTNSITSNNRNIWSP